MVNHPNRSKKPVVQDVRVYFGKIAWTWDYRLGNKIVCGPGYRTERAAHKGFADHLAERGLSAPPLPGLTG